MIRTGQQRVSWWAVGLLSTTAFMNVLVDAVSTGAMTFTLKKYISDPAAITFILSINAAFNFLVAPLVSWKSDRIWTRWGRRRPFMLAALPFVALGLIATPYAPSLWTLIVVIVVLNFAVDVGFTGPWAPLFYEVVPSPQRGRAVVLKRAMAIGAQVVFNYVLIRQFDSIYALRLGGVGFTLTGEQLIYLVTAAVVLACVANLWLNVRETPPEGRVAEPGERFRPLVFLRDMFGSRQWLLVYLLVFCNLCMQAGLGPLQLLMITEQFGYTKNQLGLIGTATFVANILLVLPLAALLADRFDRFRVFQAGVFISTLCVAFHWLYVGFVTPIPSITFLILYGLVALTVDQLAALSLEPYIYDLAPRGKMGIINGGFAFVAGLMVTTMRIGVGLWVTCYSSWFADPARFDVAAGRYDYNSGNLYVAILGLIGCAGTLLFARERRAGRVRNYGQEESGQATVGSQSVGTL